MAKIIINTDKCKGCLLCVEFCPKKMIKKSAHFNKLGINAAELSHDKGCLGCAICAVICPDCCIEVYK